MPDVPSSSARTAGIRVPPPIIDTLFGDEYRVYRRRVRRWL